MSFVRITIVATGAVVAFATSASADFRYAGSPKFGQYYVSGSVMSARAELLPQARLNSSDTQVSTPKSYMRKGGISSRGI